VFAAAIAGIALRTAEAFPYEGSPVTNGGTISGVVKFDGIPHKPARLANWQGQEVCGAHPIFDESLVVGSGGAIRNAVVTIADIAKGEPMKLRARSASIKRAASTFPHVIAFPTAAREGAELPTAFCIACTPNRQSIRWFDMAQPGFKKTLSVMIAKPEAVRVTWRPHNWMEGWWLRHRQSVLCGY